MFTKEVDDFLIDLLEHGTSILTASIQRNVHGEVVDEDHHGHQAVVTIMTGDRPTDMNLTVEAVCAWCRIKVLKRNLPMFFLSKIDLICSFCFIIKADLQAFSYLRFWCIYLRYAGWSGMKKKRLPLFSGAAILKIQVSGVEHGRHSRRCR